MVIRLRSVCALGDSYWKISILIRTLISFYTNTNTSIIFIKTARDANVVQILLHILNHAIVNKQIIIIGSQLQRRRRRRRKLFEVRPWLAADRRMQCGQYATLMEELRTEDTNSLIIGKMKIPTCEAIYKFYQMAITTQKRTNGSH